MTVHYMLYILGVCSSANVLITKGHLPTLQSLHLLYIKGWITSSMSYISPFYWVTQKLIFVLKCEGGLHVLHNSVTYFTYAICLSICVMFPGPLCIFVIDELTWESTDLSYSRHLTCYTNDKIKQQAYTIRLSAVAFSWGLSVSGPW